MRESSFLDILPRISSAAPRNEYPASLLSSPYLFSFMSFRLSLAAPVLFAEEEALELLRGSSEYNVDEQSSSKLAQEEIWSRSVVGI